MTPTEQDNELREKVATIVEYWDFSPLQDEDSRIERLKDEIMQLITADRKRVALEARMDELDSLVLKWFEDNYKNGASLGDDAYVTEYQLGSYRRGRIAELKAQQEEA